MLPQPATLWRCFTEDWCQSQPWALTADRELQFLAGEACCVGGCAEIGPSIFQGGRRDQEGPIRVEMVMWAG